MANIQGIIQQLTRERDRIDAAIRALQLVAVPFTNSNARAPRAKVRAKRAKRRLSAEGRARIAAAAKARWAAAKRAGKRSL